MQAFLQRENEKSEKNVLGEEIRPKIGLKSKIVGLPRSSGRWYRGSSGRWYWGLPRLPRSSGRWYWGLPRLSKMPQRGAQFIPPSGAGHGSFPDRPPVEDAAIGALLALLNPAGLFIRG